MTFYKVNISRVPSRTNRGSKGDMGKGVPRDEILDETLLSDYF